MLDLAMKKLTEREMQILNLVKLGKANKEIGSILCISDQTVKNHMTFIFIKLGAKDRTHAVYLTLRAGIIDFE